MKKRICILLLFLMIPTSLIAQTRIRFQKGKSSATVTGFLGSEERKSYIIGAKRGQKMTLVFRAFGGTVFVTDQNGNREEMPEYKQDMSYTFTKTGDVTITVYKEGGGGTEYSLKVTIR